MRGVSGIAKNGAAGGARRVARSAGAFSLDGPAGANAAAPETAAASAAAAVGALSLLAAQEDGGGRAGRDAAARRRASSILDELRGLQTELLGGSPDPARLARLAALETGDEGVDPGLRDAVRAVALRARVEAELRSRHAGAHRSKTVP